MAEEEQGGAQTRGARPSRSATARAVAQARKQQRQSNKASSRERASDSASQSLAESILRAIEKREYECLICFDGVSRKSDVWACRNCWKVFHIHCINRWRKTSGATQETSSWRCPGCQHTHNVKTVYTCWCGRQTNPDKDPFVPPHSCGATCGKRRSAECVHLVRMCVGQVSAQCPHVYRPGFRPAHSPTVCPLARCL